MTWNDTVKNRAVALICDQTLGLIETVRLDKAQTIILRSPLA